MSFVMPVTKYFTASERLKRTGLCILFLYVVLNGSSFNLAYGSIAAIVALAKNASIFWAVIGIAAIAISIFSLGIFMIRRWRLARTQTDITLLSLRTGLLTAIIFCLVAVAGRIFAAGGAFETATYWSIFQWLWQIPVGFFVGTGLSWSIVDRQIAGVFATDERSVNHDAPPTQ